MTLRSTEPKEFGPLSIAAALTSAILMFAAFLAIGRYHSEAEHLREIAYDASQVEVSAYRAGIVEWKAVSGRTDGSIERSSEPSFQSIDKQLRRLKLTTDGQVDLQPVLAASEAYRREAAQEFALLAKGRTNEAREYDENAVDPAFDRLVTQLARVEHALVSQAEFADNVEQWATRTIAATTIVLVALLAHWHQKRVIRENRAHALRLGAEAAERRMRALLERSTTQVLVTDGQGVIVNEWAPVKPFSALSAPRLGAKIEASFATSSQPAVREAIENINNGRALQQFEASIGDGSDAVIVDCSVTDYRDEPLINGLLWTCTDVTEKHRASAKFSEVHDRLNNILILSHAAVWSASLEGSVLDYISDGCEPIFGRTADEFLKNPNLWRDVIHADDRDSIYPSKIAELEQSGQVIFEYRIVRPDGSIRWVTNSIRLKRDSSGNAIGKEGALLDITEEQLARIELAESRKRTERTMARVPCIVYQLVQTSGDGLRFSYVGPQCRELLDLDPDDVVRDSSLYYRNVHPDDLAELNRRRAASAELGSEFNWEGRVLVKGEYRWFRTWAVPDGDELGQRHWDGVSFDITDSKRAQEIAIEKATAEQANAAKSDFLSRMSHELRTPLNAILGFGQLLQMQVDDSGQLVMLGHIVDGGRHLLSLVNEILDISRIESHRIAINPEPLDLPRMLREVVDLLTPAAGAQGVEVHIEECDAAARFAYADPQRFRQILVNLVTNAVKYNRPGGHVTLEAQRIGPRVHAIVQDDGPGIPPDVRDRLFTAFDRLGAEQTNVEGTGLGLALSHRLAEAMNGAITFEEAPGGGCRFIVDLPATSDCPEAPTQTATTPGSTTEVARDVLYIEDNFSNVELMRSVAGQTNVNLIVSSCGRDGVERAKVLQPDLILLDLDLPDIPGQEVLFELTNDSETSHIPVVIVSADANLARIEMASEGGASGYLTKPFDVSRVLSILLYGPDGERTS